jgi:hypothetical protein
VRQPAEYETEREFQIWKATTSNLALRYIKDENQALVQKAADSVHRDFVSCTLDVIGCFRPNSDEYLRIQLREISERSVALDQKMCRQVARFDWIFPLARGPIPFDAQTMEVDLTEAAPQPGQYVDLAVAPGLMKRGTSTGENFDTELLLLKMTVSCLPLSPVPNSTKVAGPDKSQDCPSF